MKKLFIIATVACVTLASCMKNEPANSLTGQSEDKITFESPILAPNVKAVSSYETGDLSQSATFSVWGFLTPTQIASTGLTETLAADNRYIDGATVSYADAEWSAGNYYWPQNGYISFVGYLPAGSTNGVFDVTDEGLQITDYTTDGTEDLLVSEIIYDQTKNIAADGVQMVFKHALSALKFTVATELEDVTITLKSITLKKVYKTGDFNQGLSATQLYMGNAKDDEDNVVNACWTAEGTKVDYPVYSGEQLIDDNLFKPADGGIDLIVVPQALDQNVEVEVVYSYKNDSMNTGVDQTVTAPLLLAGVPNAWYRGYCYTYNLNIHLDKITFSPEVEDWKDGDEHAIVERPQFN